MRAAKGRAVAESLPRGRVRLAIVVLIALTFSKFVYMAAYSSYFTFYLIDRFGLSRADRRRSICSSSWPPWRWARSSAGRSATGSGANG